MKKLLQILLGTIFISLTSNAHAVPAYPHTVEYTQPDGKVIQMNLKGDEYVHWAETIDGYTILQNEQGYYVYAVKNTDGSLGLSNTIVSPRKERKERERAFLSSMQKGLRYSKKQIAKFEATFKKDASRMGGFPTTGTNDLLMVMANFNNTSTTYGQTDFDNYMNQANYNGTGSFKDYYFECSYGQLTVNTTVTVWVTVPNTHDYYGPQSNWGEFAYDAVVAAENQAGVDFSQFDNDGDGVVDGVAIIHQGQGQEVSGNTNDIWSHSWNLSSAGYTAAQRTFDGVEVNAYTTQPEIADASNNMASIGVMCHEFGHNLGAPDYYDTDYSTGGQYSGTGNWDLMASGAYNGSPSGAVPAHHNVFTKWYYYGWLTPTELTTGQTVTLNNIETNQEAYYYTTPSTNEYWLIENRQLNGFDAYLPGSGMIIYHVDQDNVDANYSSNEINITHPQYMYPVCASATTDPSSTPSDYGSISSAGCPFPGTSNSTEFSDASTPSSTDWSGNPTNKPITNITENAGFITFDFMGGDSGNPGNVNASAVSSTQIDISWTLNPSSDPVLLAWSTDGTFGTPTDGTTYSAGDNISGGGTVLQYGTGISYSHTGLSASTRYYYKVWSNDGTAYSTGVTTDATTLCGAITTYPYNQDFDSWTTSSPAVACTPDGTVTLEQCWSNATGDAIDWDIFSGSTGSTETGPSADHTSGSGNYLYTESSGPCNSTGYIYSPSFDFSSISNPLLEFWYHMYGVDMGTLSVQASTDGGSSWSADLWSQSGDQGDNWLNASIDISSYQGYSNVIFRFTAVQGIGYYSDIAIDDFTVSAGCTPPTTQASSFSVTTVNDNDITINWARGNGDAVLVVAKKDSDISVDPINGSTYTASSIFGAGDETGAGSYVVYNNTGTSATITGLSPGTTYYFAIYEYNDAEKCYLTPALTGNETTTVTPISYCSASGGGDEHISGVELEDIINTGTGASGYADYTSSVSAANLYKNHSYDITITNGNTYLTDDLGIWIDFNHDGDFDDTGENVVCAVDDGANGTYNFTIPTGATIGQTVMRIRIKYSNSDCGSPCGATTYGEVEDYSVNILPTYNVTFNVSNSIDPHQGAEVTLAGYGSQTTDASGQTIFSNVIPENNISYTVSATGFEDNTGAVDVVSSDVNESVTLQPAYTSIYDIQYTSDASGDSPLIGSVVKTSGIVTAVKSSGFYIQDSSASWNGLLVYTSGVPAVSQGDSVVVSGYVDEYFGETEINNPPSISIISTGNDLPAPMALTTNNVNNENYEGILVSVEGAIVTPNTGDTHVDWKANDGSGAINLDEIIYDPGYTSGEYYNITGVVRYSWDTYRIQPRSVDDVLLLYNVTFVVDNGTDSIQDATVSLTGYGSKTTNSLGQAVFNGIAPENGIAYSISATGYEDASGSLDVIDADVTENITLQPLYTVTFLVDDGTNPVTGAQVTLSGFGTGTTNSSGEVTFTDVSIESGIDYLVAATSYDLVNGTVDVIDNDVTESLSLNASPYCHGTASSSWEHINQVDFNATTNGNTGLGYGGYQDFTSIVTDVLQGETCSITITLGSAYDQDQARVWADWNQDGDFEDTGEMVFESGVGLGPFSGSFDIPSDATTGQTRMRIRVWDSSSEAAGVNGGPCGEETWGEVEDYTLNIEPTFNVTFNITDGTNPIEGAEVNFDGYGVKTTDVTGAVVYNHIVPSNNISYTVTKQDYDDATGTIDVVDANVTENVIMNLTAYNVTFVVDDGTDPIENATVNLSGYGNMITDATGVATFNDVIPGNDIVYTVTAQNYDEYTDSVDVVDANVTDSVSLTLTTYDVTFIVDDGTNPIDGATVNLYGYGNITTNASGEALFTNVAPDSNINYTVTATGYNDLSGSMDVVDSDVTEYVSMILTTFQVTFNVNDGTAPLQGASVMLSGYGTHTTNANGQVFYTDVIPQNDIQYTVTSTGYDDVTGTIDVIDANITENVIMSLSVYDITFRVSDQSTGNPLSGASVSFNGTSQTTSASGETVFTGVEHGTGYNYTVTATDYNDATGQMAVTGNDTVDVSMIPEGVTTYMVTFNINDGTNAIQGASINLNGYGQQTTNTSGQAVFSSVAPQTNINYSVQAPGYDPYNGDVDVINADVTENVSLNITTYQVSFVVDDGSNPIEGASVNLTGYGAQVTGSSGVAIFTEVAPASSIGYTVTAANYDDQTGSIDVIDVDVNENVSLNVSTYDVTFNISDQTNGNPIIGASVTFNGSTQTTNSSGQAIFADVNAGSTYNYTITNSGYYNTSGSITVDENETVDVSMIPEGTSTYTVTFNVDDGANSLEGATVNLSGYGTQTTDASGIATFNNVVPATGISYTVSASGYTDSTGTVDVVSSPVNVDISLSLITYQVTFYVNDGTTSIENATVSLNGYGSENTDASGMAVFTGVVPAADINYTVAATGYDGVAGSIDVIDSDINEYVVMSITTYQVTFNIDDGANPIAGAAVNLTGYGTQATDASGQAIFNNVIPETGIAYTVVADNYDDTTGTVDVLDSDVTENVSMTLTTYDVTFVVDDGTDPIANATVTLAGYGSQTTDASGQAVFTSIVPETGIAYTVTADIYDDSTGTIDVVDSDITENVSMTLTTYDVTFVVDDGTDPIANATVTLAGYSSQTTDASGQAIFNNVIPESGIAYTVSADNYDDTTGTVDVVDSDVTENVSMALTTYNVTFIIEIGTSPAEGAVVNLTGYGQQTTDATGTTTFENVAPGNIAYTVEMTGYSPITGTVTVVDSDVTELLTLPAFEVTFIVYDEEDEPIENASVNLTGYGEQITGTNGQAIFNSVAPENNIDYTVTATGYLDKNGNINVVDAPVTEYVTMVTDRVKNIAGKGVNIYPNPTRSNITINLGELNGKVTYLLKSSTGQILENKLIDCNNVNTYELKLKRYGKGVYFLHLSGKDYNAVTKVIVN